MKTIGLIGGMSWESTAAYYRLINEGIKQHLGGLHSAKIVLYSVDFQEIEHLQREGDWQAAGEALVYAAQAIERAGADCVLIATNTMHKVAPMVESATQIPLLNIADATAQSIQKAGLQKVGLLGTRFTMEQDFYKNRMTDRYGIDVVIPNEAERHVVHQIIYEELCLGQIKDESRTQYRQIIHNMVERDGVEAVILGCTEISLLVGESDSPVPLFDTTAIHTQPAVEFALSLN